MKTKLITLLVLPFFLNTFSQEIGLHKKIISTEVLNVQGVSYGDFDSDGDQDVVSISWDFGVIAWFENTDGLGNFDPTAHIITTNMTYGYSVITADINGDGNIDVIGSSSSDKVVWYENLGGGDFGDINTNEQIITTDVDSTRGIDAADLNGDGYIDVLSSSRWDDKIAWYENIDGLGNFGSQRIITTNAIRAQDVYTADLDGDGDLDVLSASSNDNKIAWYENTDGLGSFGPQQDLTIFASGARRVYAADLDNDLDLDVLSASEDDNKIAWYENTNGLGNFGSQQILTETAWGTRTVIATDFDNDGDNDVLYNAPNTNTIAWLENIGGLFSDPKALDTSSWAVLDIDITDINGDGDLDVIAANYLQNETTWYEQIEILFIDENTLSNFSVYPIPTSGMLNIQSKTNIVQIEIYNQLGQLILTNTNKNTIDISSFSRGIYFIKIKDEYGAFGTQKVMRK